MRKISPPVVPPRHDAITPPGAVDLVDEYGQLIAPCDDWGSLMARVLAGIVSPGRYRVVDGRNVRLADLAVDGSGAWRMYGAAARRRQ